MKSLNLQLFYPHALALALYAALTAIALDQLVLHMASAVPAVGGWDYAIFYWNLWWAKYAVFNLHRDPMFSNYVLYPNTVNLALHTHTFSLGLLTAPLQAVLDLKLIYNGLAAGSCIASAYFTFLFLRRRLQSEYLAILGGALFTFTSITVARAADGQLNLLQTGWLPLQLLLWDGAVTGRRAPVRLAAAAGLGLALYLTWMTDVQYVMWVAPLLGLYALYTWAVECQGRERLRVAGLALVAGACLVGPALIEPIPALLQARGLSFPQTDMYTLKFFSYRLSWLWMRDSERMDDNIGQLLPLLTLLSLLSSLRRKKIAPSPTLPRRTGEGTYPPPCEVGGPRSPRWLWLATGLVLFILALGPYVYGTDIPLPYWLLNQLLGGQYRTPTRFTTPASLALIAFVTMTLDELFRRKIAPRWQPWVCAVLLAGLVFDSRLLEPFPVTFLPDYSIYHEIGQDQDEYALLEVPVGPASGFGEFGDASDLQFYAYIHHKQIINGIVSRVPGVMFSPYQRSPLLRGLTGEYDFPPLDAAGRELADKLDRWDMRYVLVHRDRLAPERARTIVQFLNVQPGLCPVSDEGAMLAYRRIDSWAECPHPEVSALPESLRLEIGRAGDERYLGPGWYGAENIGGPQGRWAGEIATATLRLLLPRQDTRVSFNAWAYPAEQSVSVLVNHQAIAQIPLAESWQEYAFDIPAEMLPADGSTLIELAHTQLLSAAQRTDGQSPDPRPLAAAYSWFEFSRRSPTTP